MIRFKQCFSSSSFSSLKRALTAIYFCLSGAAFIPSAQAASSGRPIRAAPCSDQNGRNDGDAFSVAYQVGAAQADITGPVVGVGMMGYAEFSQVDEGIHMRLRSRALVVSDADQVQGCGAKQSKTVAIVVNDMAMIFYSVKGAVVAELNKQLPGVFSDDNVLLSATHGHSGPGGYAYHLLYNITSFGFSPENFDVIVKGTVRAIVAAYQQRQPASLAVGKGELNGIQFNRSPDAYDANPAAERANYVGKSDPEMLLLRADSERHQPIAAFNWFAVHGVSLPITNKLVSGDNKGLAAYLFEKKMGATYLTPGEFVAGFEQANSGDISSYDVSTPADPKDDGFARNRGSANAQFGKALELYNKPDLESIEGPVAYAHRFEDLAYKAIDPRFTNGSADHLCNGVLGVSFAAGTANGAPFPIFKQGTVYGKNWPEITLMPEEQACHQEKVLLLPTGFVQPEPWTARIAPFQLVRIGQLAIIATPFEITTMAGRRLKKAVLETLRPYGVRYVALSAVANEYLHYVTTREEYGIQDYEGGATLFGPWSLAAYTEIFTDLALDMALGRVREGGDTKPNDLSQDQIVLPHEVLFDLPPDGGQFGDVKTNTKDRYKVGQKPEVVFYGAHLNNALAPDASYLTIEKSVTAIDSVKNSQSLASEPSWTTMFYDWDGAARLRWQRDGLAGSLVSIIWDMAADTAPGTYRICHKGKSKPVDGSGLVPYRGCSKPFDVEL